MYFFNVATDKPICLIIHVFHKRMNIDKQFMYINGLYMLPMFVNLWEFSQ